MKTLLNHNSEETAYLVNDYPYGFRLRTQIRYWVETKKGKGQRFCSQTLNPKTNRWNKPKKSTYSLAIGMYLDEKDHVQWKTLEGNGWDKEEYLKQFEQEFAPLSDYHKLAIKHSRATNEMSKVLKVTVSAGSSTQTKEEQQEIYNRALNYGYAKVEGKI